MSEWFLFKRGMRYWWQRRVRGWDDSETWSLDHSLAKHIAPRLKRFKALNIAYPPSMKPEHWDRVLDMMIESFDLQSDPNMDWQFEEVGRRKVRAGLFLFHRYYFDLWW